ncbi:MAG: hypothetical protein P8P98_06250, partial [Emcibacteraceae bacterium]|nr:hypothetical protein [Emcibacteraceae bacterium]
MFKKIILITALLLSQSFAGQSNNEAEFERLYFEYHNNLIDGADYDVIMQLAVMLHKLAPQVYGKNSANTAEVTYNLARLLDETGGKEFNANELMSTQLYQ